MPTDPTAAILRNAIPADIRRLIRATATRVAAKKKSKAKVPLEDLNAAGQQSLQDNPNLQDEAQDTPAYQQVLDVLDVPRNLIANVAGGAMGVDTSQSRKGTFGLPVVTGEDILDKLGVEPGVGRSIAGFGMEVLGDPLTYLGGAGVGVKVGKYGTRLLKPGIRALRGLAKSAAWGEHIAPELARIVGHTPQSLANFGRALVKTQIAKGATEAVARQGVERALMGRRGGLLLRTIEAHLGGPMNATPEALARFKGVADFVAKNAAKGRPIAAIPFTEHAIFSPIGREARMVKELKQAVAGTGAGAKKYAEVAAKGGAALAATAGRVGIEKNIARMTGEVARLKDIRDAKAEKYQTTIKALTGPGTPRLKTTLAPMATSAVRKAKRELDIAHGMYEQAVRKVEAIQKIKAEVGPSDLIQQLKGKYPVTPKAEQVMRGKIQEARQAVQRATDIPVGAGPVARPVMPEAIVGARGAAKGRIATGKAELKAAEKVSPKIPTISVEIQQARTPAILAGADYKAAREALVPRIREAKVTLAAKKESEILAKATREAFRTSAEAPETLKAIVRERIGRRFDMPPNASAFRRWLVNMSRAKGKLFGPGESMLTRERSAVEARLGLGSVQEGARAADKVTNAARPIVTELAKRLGIDESEAMHRLFDVVEAGKSYHAEDPIFRALQSTQETLAAIPKGNEFVTDTRKMLDDLHAFQKAHGVDVGKIEKYVPHGLAKDARNASIEQERRMGRHGWNDSRVTRQQYQTADGKVVDLLSSDERVAALEAQVKSGQAKKLGEWDISARQWDDWRQQGGPGAAAFQPGFRGPQVETDVGTAVGSAFRRAAQRIAAVDLGHIIKANGAVQIGKSDLAHAPEFAHMVPLFGDGWNRNTPLAAALSEQLSGLAAPQQVADALRRVNDLSTRPDKIKGILAISDRIFNLWKGITLFHPAYALRNFMQNLVGGQMAGAPALSVGKKFFEADMARIMRQADKGEAITGTIRIAGRQTPAADFIESLRRYGIINSGYMSQALDPNMFKRAKNAIGKGYRKWFEFNNHVDNRMRASIMATFLDQGYSVRQAALKSMTAIPDMMDITMFERNVAARLFPWYRWQRKNLALQLFTHLPNKPWMYAGTEKFRRAMEGMLTGHSTVPEDLRPDWSREQQAMQILGDKEAGSVFLLAPWLPFQEMTQLFSVATGPQGFTRAIVNNLRPELRFIPESASGIDAFRMRKVEPFSWLETASMVPKAFVGQSATPLDNLLALRPAREVVRVGQQGSTGGMIARGILGGSVQPVNKAKGLQTLAVNLQQQAQDLRKQVYRAQQSNDTAAVASLSKQWIAKMKRIHELGLKGVPKATQSMLQKQGVKAGSKAYR